MDAIKTTKLTKYYGKSRGIVDLDLTVALGDFFGFIGPNGAGKSTTIRTLLGLLKPSNGSGEILGFDILKDQETILQKTGYLASESIFYNGMKVKELLKLSADLRKIDCTEETKKLCSRLELDTSKKIEELSFGNRKKVGIICALQHRPELLILDEPTSGLDPLMQKEFFDILQERNREGTTIFLSSHILAEVQRNCTKAAIIRDGHVIACDRVENLSKTTAKRITVHGDVDFQALEGIRNLKKEGNVSSFLYSGEMNLLLHTLSKGNVLDLAIAEPDLEEMFLHYYERTGEKV